MDLRLEIQTYLNEEKFCVQSKKRGEVNAYTFQKKSFSNPDHKIQFNYVTNILGQQAQAAGRGQRCDGYAHKYHSQ